MAIKKTKLLVAELRVIADLQPNEHCRKILIQAAERLDDTDKIARFYRNTAEILGGGYRGRARRKLCGLPILLRTKQYGATQESNDKMRGSK